LLFLFSTTIAHRSSRRCCSAFRHCRRRRRTNAEQTCTKSPTSQLATELGILVDRGQ